MTYQEYKNELESKFGYKAEWDYDKQPLNEVARLLTEFRVKRMTEAKVQKKIENKLQNDVQPSLKPEIEAKEIKEKLDSLNGLVPVESDLDAFKGISKEILRVYLVNQDISPKKLANAFGVSYQFVSGLLNSKAVQLLRSKYFHKQLDNNTKIGLLKLTEDADSKIVLAAAEYLKILHEKDNEDVESKIVDPLEEKALKLLGDWLAGNETELIIKRSDLE